MKCYENFLMFENQQTPIGLDQLPDQMKPILERNLKQQNFDIILSKFFNNGELTDIELQQLNEHQKTILQEVKKKIQQKTKRPDEYQKLFFKKAFKYAEHSFFKKNKKNRSRRMSQFYHHHFDSVALALKIPLINFYHPDKKTKPGLSTGQKSFNSSYVKTILKSLSFRNVCLEYHAKFKEDCKNQRNKKISTFVASLFSLIDKDKKDKTKLIKFLQSSKCKIPWIDRDINEAFVRAAEDLEDFSVETSSKQFAKEKGLLHLYDQSNNNYNDPGEGIELLQYNDELLQEQKENFSSFKIEIMPLMPQNEFRIK